MAVDLKVQTIDSPEVTEFYISVSPEKEEPLRKQANEIFSSIRDALNSKNACIFQERIFGTESAMGEIAQIRSQVYGDIDDGVTPSFLVCCKDGPLGSRLCGVQIHAISANGVSLEVVGVDGIPTGRVIHAPNCDYLGLSAISMPQSGEPMQQAQAMFEKAEAALKQSGADFLSVPRTWIWLNDILSWYGEFNHVRNKFFTERGLVGKGNRQSMPASTGIGLSPATGGSCAMDLTAVLEPPDSIQFLEAVGKQQCAFEYGSAFSRASRAITPAGETVFVSGTASIDASGATTNIGDAEGQISTTIENVKAVLHDMKCTPKDVMQVTAYCKTPEIKQLFNKLKNGDDWPWVTLICDICRDDLLFEIEATAMFRK